MFYSGGFNVRTLGLFALGSACEYNTDDVPCYLPTRTRLDKGRLDAVDEDVNDRYIVQSPGFLAALIGIGVL